MKLTTISVATSLMMLWPSNSISFAVAQDVEQITYTGTIIVTNVAPEQGTCQSPVFVGIHDGSFDIYDLDSPIPPTTERLVEDGNSAPLIAALSATEGAAFTGRVGNGPICVEATLPFELTVTVGEPLYFSFGTMVLPSNDAFLSNDDPMEYEIVNRRGGFNELSITLFGNDVLDAGSEVNDEVPANTPFFGQMTPDTGVVEKGVVTEHPGHKSPGSGGILDDPSFENADFTTFRYEMLEINVVLDGEEEEEDGFDLMSFLIGRWIFGMFS